MRPSMLAPDPAFVGARFRLLPTGGKGRRHDILASAYGPAPCEGDEDARSLKTRLPASQHAKPNQHGGEKPVKHGPSGIGEDAAGEPTATRWTENH
jgi:hypothetical protein